MKERRDAIRKFIEAHGEVSISQLTAEFGEWSEMTLRRDLAYLEQAKQILLTRGGARSYPGARYGLSEDVYSERERRNFSAKQLIASKAVSLVEPGKGIFIDAGTTAMAFAKLLPNENLVVITSAPNIALEVVARKSRPQVVILGGTLSHRSLALAEPEIPAQLEKLNIDTAFLSASGYDAEAGFTVGSQLDGMLKREIVRRARRVVLMMDSSKAGSLLPYTFARAEEIDLFVSDDALPPETRAALEKSTRVL